MDLLLILGILAIALLIIIPILEKHGRAYTQEETKKLSRWIMPLVALLLVIQILVYYFA
jgi:H+/Cl- antiporter ClcA